jgi:predicted metalloprotease with PDZ domain
MSRKISSLSHFLLAFLLIDLDAHAAFRPSRQFHIDYTVELSNPDNKLFHVTASVENIHQARLNLSLPVWTPGWYSVENYAKNLVRFKISDASGKVLPHQRKHKQTWSVNTRGLRHIRVEFDYRADQLMANQAWITNDFAFFTGTQLFLMAEGHRASPSTINFRIPADWKIISALKETSDPLTFTSPDYDTPVDAPTEIGRFDVTRFEVEGKPHYFTAAPADSFSAEGTRKFTQMLEKIATAQGAIFGGLPYDKYIFFYFFWPPGATRQANLEHSSSQVVICPPAELAERDVGRLAWTASHEFFHLWNVKRIRPVEMWPYDYSGENETALLWVSEGFSDYYGSLARYRSGLTSRAEFLKEVGANIRDVEKNDARNYISLAESSTATWLSYGDLSDRSSLDYYSQGQYLGVLLDLSIRHDTKGRASLDDVMRGLYRDFYQHAKGFSIEDMIRIINRLTNRDYHDFYRRYVSGVEVPPTDAILAYAGFRIEKTALQLPALGFGGRPPFDRVFTVGSVAPGSSAADAGLLVGDVITATDGEKQNNPSVRAKMNSPELVGKTIKLTINRAGQEHEISFEVGSRKAQEVYNVVELSQSTPQQVAIREGWLNLKH